MEQTLVFVIPPPLITLLANSMWCHKCGNAEQLDLPVQKKVKLRPPVKVAMPFSSHTSNFFFSPILVSQGWSRPRLGLIIGSVWVPVEQQTRCYSGVKGGGQSSKRTMKTLASAPTGARSPAEVWVSSQAGCASLTPEVVCTLPSGSACGYWCLLLSDYTCRGRGRGGWGSGENKKTWRSRFCWTRLIFILSAGAPRKIVIPHCCAAVRKTFSFLI